MRFVAYAEQKSKRWRGLVQMGLQHGSKRRNAGPGGDEQRITRRLAQHEHSEWRPHLHRVAVFHGEQQMRENSIRSQVQVQLETSSRMRAIRRGGDGIGSRDGLAP